MAIRRTLQDKKTAQLKRETHTYTYANRPISNVTPVALKHQPDALQHSLFGYPVTLIYSDLVRSLVVTAIIVLCLAGLYLKLSGG